MKKVKILVFEYITGGGFNKADLPEALAREGLLMLRSLLDGLAGIEMVELSIMLDFRMTGSLFTSANSLEYTKPSPEGRLAWRREVGQRRSSCQESWVRGNQNKETSPVASLNPNIGSIYVITPDHECLAEFAERMTVCDAVWPIAPESDGILQSVCEAVEQAGKILLTSPASAVAVAGNKWLTYQRLRENSVATIPTQRLGDFTYTSGEWMLKPLDGVGCEASYLVTKKQDFTALTASLNKEKYLVQPHIHGEKTSLSCLFKQGQAWLLCANRQHFELINQQYCLKGIIVNDISDTSRYQALAQAIAKVMPDLWGYAGIDLIETADEILVLEINPRLTTSYVGIHEALGVNCAKLTLDLLAGDPQLNPTRNQTVYLNLKNQDNNAS